MSISKRVLITAGPVYGRLDDNKLVGNRARGIWATRFAQWLALRGHQVTVLVADTYAATRHAYDVLPGWSMRDVSIAYPKRREITYVTHDGFTAYADQCRTLAGIHDAAVMAAAVVNWIPAHPITGKMSTTSLAELVKQGARANLFERGDVPVPGQTVVHIPFILAPRVIDAMRAENPKLTLIGCKMTIGASHDDMLDAAWKTLVGAKCHAVFANDLNSLRQKTVLYPDGAKFSFNLNGPSSDLLYTHLEAIINDEHFHTASCGPSWLTERTEYEEAARVFNVIVDKHRQWLLAKHDGTDHVFGAVAARVPGQEGGAICTPRVKSIRLSADDAVDVAPIAPDDLEHRRVVTVGGHKATMNATLLLRHLDKYPQAAGVLHLHEQLPNVPTAPYAPPGTVRDNLREIPAPVYNIEGHGFIAAVDKNGGILA